MVPTREPFWLGPALASTAGTVVFVVYLVANTVWNLGLAVALAVLAALRVRRARRIVALRGAVRCSGTACGALIQSRLPFRIARRS